MERIAITGGAGFIGSNLAHRLLQEGRQVTIFDNLSRVGGQLNVSWLEEDGWGDLRVVCGDIRDYEAVSEALRGVDIVYHLAGQVSALASIQDPRRDFEINALGTLNVLEAARLAHNMPIVVTASSNKVYGELEELAVQELDTRYAFVDLPYGVSEGQSLEPCTPYGCSKAAADQYARDYARIYGLRTVVLRLSTIYGPRQFGTEDQGWIAYFAIQAALGRPIVRYGTGKQVRDVLFVDDLVHAFCRIPERIEKLAGKVYNVGGGPQNSLSVWCEFEPLLSAHSPHPPQVSRVEAARALDQLVYISDIRRIEQDLGWSPTVDTETGLTRLLAWIGETNEVPSKGGPR